MSAVGVGPDPGAAWLSMLPEALVSTKAGDDIAIDVDKCDHVTITDACETTCCLLNAGPASAGCKTGVDDPVVHADKRGTGYSLGADPLGESSGTAKECD